MLDILIKNGTVVDGTGEPAFKADVGVANGCVTVMNRGRDKCLTF
jgi:N-acyl-D-aspartate/D-glutamate deacylase